MQITEGKQFDWRYDAPTYIPERCPYENACHNNRPCHNMNGETQYVCTNFGADVNGDKAEKQIRRAQVSIRRFNRAIKKIKYIDRYSLEGIHYWRVYQLGGTLSVHPWRFGEELNKKGWLREGKQLIDAGFNLEFSEDSGVGRIIKHRDGTFSVELWQYRMRSFPILHVSLKKALKWIWKFIWKPD
jgi:hypothetical protein